jgi:hypothetical protein
MNKLTVYTLSSLLLTSICVAGNECDDLEDRIKPPTSVPEPSTYALVGITGLVWFGVVGARRFRK